MANPNERTGRLTSAVRFSLATPSAKMPEPRDVARLGSMQSPGKAMWQERLVCYAIFLLTVLSLLFISCGERERVNPLDPLNPLTGGSPPGFRAIAGDGMVELHWSALKLRGLRGFNLYRRQGTGNQVRSFQLMDGSPFSPATDTAIDSSVVNGTTYYYKLVPLIDSYGEGKPSPLVPATPGPHFAVASDGWSGVVRQFSADLRTSIWTVGGLYYPFCVVSQGQSIWVTDLYGSVLRLADDGSVLWRTTGFLLPLWVSARADGISAVADPVKGTVTILSPEGRPQTVITQGLQGPTCVSFDGNGELWVADPAARRVNKYDAGGSLLASFTDCIEPRFLDAEMTGGSCWVADVASDELIRLSSGAQELVRVASFVELSAVEVDENTGGCWVADSGREEIVKVSQQGEVMFAMGGIGEVVWIHVSQDDGSIWLADEKASQLLALTREGRVISSTTLLGRPTSLTVLRAR